jgi:hypothetical protein
MIGFSITTQEHRINIKNRSALCEAKSRSYNSCEKNNKNETSFTKQSASLHQLLNSFFFNYREIIKEKG